MHEDTMLLWRQQAFNIHLKIYHVINYTHDLYVKSWHG